MPAPTPPPTEAAPTTEAEAIAGLLGEMGVTLAVVLPNEGLFAQVSHTGAAGAADVLRIATERYDTDTRFREDMTLAVGTHGYWLAEAPGIPDICETASADAVLDVLARFGLDVRVLSRPSADRDAGRLAYLTLLDRLPVANAHLLMKLCDRRFAEDPAFADAMLTILQGAGTTPPAS